MILFSSYLISNGQLNRLFSWLVVDDEEKRGTKALIHKLPTGLLHSTHSELNKRKRINSPIKRTSSKKGNHPHVVVVMYNRLLLPRPYVLNHFSPRLLTTLSQTLLPAQYQKQQPAPDYVHALNRSLGKHNSTIDPFSIVSNDLDILTRSMLDCVAIAEHPVLNHAAGYFLSVKGKRIRPVIVVLMARATAGIARENVEATAGSNERKICDGQRKGLGDVLGRALKGLTLGELLPGQLKLAEITEMIHTASLLHDDVIDVSEKRRGVGSVNSIFGNQLAVLAGDFLLARASASLARLRDCDVVELLSKVIEHLVRGEVVQMKDEGNVGNSEGGGGKKKSARELFENYMAKTFYKTASLMANSCRAVTMLAGHSARVVDSAYEYGKNIGIAFQLVDDVLDMTGSSQILGKPALSDLEQGVATAPVLFALEQFPDLRTAINRKFSGDNDIQDAVRCVEESQGIEKTREFARQHAKKAVLSLSQVLPPSDYRSALVNMADKVLLRQR